MPKGKKKKLFFIQDKYIKRIVKEAKKEFLKETGLKNIPIYYSRTSSNKFNYSFNISGKEKIYLNPFEIFYKVTIKKQRLFKYLPKFKSVRQRIRFIIFHELGHYLHYSKYKKSLYIEKLSSLNNENAEGEAYRMKPQERKADKIALYFIKKYG